MITKEGWKIPNIKDMLQRIGCLKPCVFGVEDLLRDFTKCLSIRTAGKLQHSYQYTT